jgi:hypothetical protein
MPTRPIVTLKGDTADREWLEGLMTHLGERSVSDVLRRAVVELARRSKFPERPPFSVRAEWGGRRKKNPEKGVDKG